MVSCFGNIQHDPGLMPLAQKVRCGLAILLQLGPPSFALHCIMPLWGWMNMHLLE